MRGVQLVAVFFERCPGCVKRLRRPAQVSRNERDLGLGNDAPRARHSLFGTEGTHRVSQERLRPNEFSETRHRDAAKCKRRRVFTQGDPVQRAKGVPRRERTRRGRDWRVRLNPATLVTPAVQCPVLIYLVIKNQHAVSRTERMTKNTQGRQER